MRAFVPVSAVAVLVGVALLIVSNGRAKPVASRPAGPDSPVVVELFTSEGCSSCPPADRLLAQLDQAQPVAGARIIALEQHVDYWNDGGWVDPFSSAQFSERQQEYVRALHASTPYTPQMVVDGAAEFVGSDKRAAIAAIDKSSRAPKAIVTVEPATTAQPSGPLSEPLRVRVEPVADSSGRDAADVILAITEDGLSSNVAGGENSGSQLVHRAVVREMRTIGQLGASGSFEAQPDAKLSKNWKRENLRAVIFVQRRGDRRILGAAEIPLAAPANGSAAAASGN